MRLVFVNRFYWPETPATGQLLTDLAEGLARHGHEVVVITSQRSPERAREETHHGVRIVRVPALRRASHGLAGKAREFGRFYAQAAWRLFREARRGTVVISLTDPPLFGIAAWMLAGLRGARLIHWVQDIYPELAIELAGQRWLAAVRPLRNAAWRGAACCIVLGGDMAATLGRAGVSREKITTIPNWSPAGVAPPDANEISTVRAMWRLGGKFIVCYSGNLGRVHDLMPVLDLAEMLRDDPRIAFVFVGDGAQRGSVEEAAKARGLTHVQFLPAQPRARLAASLAAADAHLVTLLPGCERLVFPSKLYGVAAVGRPVLFIGPRDCELAGIVRDRALGATAVRDRLAPLATAIRHWAGDPVARVALGQNALAFAAEHDAAHALARWQAILAAVQAC